MAASASAAAGAAGTTVRSADMGIEQTCMCVGGGRQKKVYRVLESELHGCRAKHLRRYSVGHIGGGWLKSHTHRRGDRMIGMCVQMCMWFWFELH